MDSLDEAAAAPASASDNLDDSFEEDLANDGQYDSEKGYSDDDDDDDDDAIPYAQIPMNRQS